MEKKIQKQEVERPVTVRILELRADLDKAAMKSMLPPFLLEMILNEYLRGISTVARQEVCAGSGAVGRDPKGR